MTSHRLATYSIGGANKYGAVTDNGIVDLSARFGKDYPTLREAIAAGALLKLAEDAARHSPDHALDAVVWQPPIPAPEKIICIGVNYPDRNAEYKDGTDAPKYPSMFLRTQHAGGPPARVAAARLRGRTGAGDRQGRPAHQGECGAGSHRRRHPVQ
jgi:2-keto-4-pentenoate hydratase/2-oxohepta-3-ene-1,7-dioic acid hydratase in catechol pathway